VLEPFSPHPRASADRSDGDLRPPPYLRQPRARFLLLCFLVSSLVLAAFPALDIRISRLFFDGTGFHLAGQWWVTLLQRSVGYAVGLSLCSVVVLYAFNRRSGRAVCGVAGRTVAYLVLVLVLGAGLVVNVLLKDTFGRARPRNIEEFGGAQQFTGAFVVSGECATNCSFSSGDAAGAFFLLATAAALSRRRAVLLAALGFGALVSFSRVASGAHFLSDVVVSFFVMLILADALHCHILLPGPELTRGRAQPDDPQPELLPLGEPGQGAEQPAQAVG
jgi:lipid A 4'-phosphatase